MLSVKWNPEEYKGGGKESYTDLEEITWDSNDQIVV
jgi:hypothetical protein